MPLALSRPSQRYPWNASDFHLPQRWTRAEARKAARKAVTRNQIRRRLRAILVRHGEKLESGRYLVIVVRRKAADASFRELEEDWLRLAGRLGILNESESRQADSA